MKVLLFALLALANQRPMKEMHGKCDNYRLARTDVEFASWEKEVGKEFQEGAPFEWKLAKKTTFETEPEKAPKPDTFGAVIPFTPKVNGRYRFSLGAKAWLDLVEKKQLVEPREFEMQTGCEKITKVVDYSLKAGHSYFVQISGAKISNLKMMLTKVE